MDIKASIVDMDLPYQSGRAALYVTGKQVIHGATGLLAGVADHGAGLMTLGLVVGLSSGLSQLDHIHRRRKLLEDYREEIAARRGKDKGAVTEQDMEKVAEGNRALSGALSHSSKERNFGIGLSVLSSLAVIGISSMLFAGPLAGMEHGVGEWIVRGAVALGSYMTIKLPLHWLANKLFGMDEDKATDKVHAIARDRSLDKQITKEQVCDVIIAGQPGLGEMIKRDYGQEYDKLRNADKRMVAEELAHVIPLDRIAADINNGILRPTELVFMAEGQQSGVQPGDPFQNAVKGKGRILPQFMRSWGDRFGALRSWAASSVKGQTDGQPMTTEALVTEAMQSSDTARVLLAEQMEQEARSSFVDRLGLAARAKGLSQVERLQARSDEAGLSPNR